MTIRELFKVCLVYILLVLATKRCHLDAPSRKVTGLLVFFFVDTILLVWVVLKVLLGVYIAFFEKKPHTEIPLFQIDMGAILYTVDIFH